MNYTEFSSGKYAEERDLLLKIFHGRDDKLMEFLSICETWDDILGILYTNIEELTDIQQSVIRLRYKLNDDRISHTFASIAKEINRSTERARQINVKATKRLFHRIFHYTEKINDTPIKLKEPIPITIDEFMGLGIESLDPSIRIYSALRRHKIYTIKDILEMNEYDLLSMRNFGVGSLHELTELMRSVGFHEWADSLKEENIKEATKLKSTGGITNKLSKFKPKLKDDDKYKRNNKHIMILGSIDGDFDGDPLQ